MQSFSPFKPVLSGTPSEIRTATFAMWLRANAFNVRRPFDRARWKTSRPWLRYSALQYQMKLYRERSLGAIILGNITLKDKDVETAMKYGGPRDLANMQGGCEGYDFGVLRFLSHT